MNDTYGHKTGDAVLKHVATLMMQEKRETDIFARFAGDEFVCVLADMEVDETDLFIQRMQALIQDPVFLLTIFLFEYVSVMVLLRRRQADIKIRRHCSKRRTPGCIK